MGSKRCWATALWCRRCARPSRRARSSRSPRPRLSGSPSRSPPAEIERQPEQEPPAEIEQQPELEPPPRPTREEIRVMCEASAVDCHSFTEYASRLAIVGVELIPTVQQQGAQLTGLSYCLDGETMKGSDVGKAYAAAGIQARGISYEQARDYESVEYYRARAVQRGDLAPPRSLAARPAASAGALEYALAAGGLAPEILAMKSDGEKAGAIKEAAAWAARAWELAASGREQSKNEAAKTRAVVVATHEVLHAALDTMPAGPTRQAAVEAQRELASRVGEYRAAQEAQQRALSRGKNRGAELEP